MTLATANASTLFVPNGPNLVLWLGKTDTSGTFDPIGGAPPVVGGGGGGGRGANSADLAGASQPAPISVTTQQSVQHNDPQPINQNNTSEQRHPMNRDQDESGPRKSKGSRDHSVSAGDKKNDPVATVAPTPLPAAPEERGLNWRVIWDSSWISKYYFRGLDVLDRTSTGNGSTGSGVFRNSLSGNLTSGDNSFTASVTNFYAFDASQPNGAVDPSRSRARLNSEQFSVAPRDRYNETDFGLYYTRQLIANKLWATVAAKYYSFNNDLWWAEAEGNGISDSWETELLLQYSLARGQAKYFDYVVTPQLSWSRDHGNFKGDFLEFTLGSTFVFPKLGFQISPYAAASYDFKYNGENSGWNNAVFGASLETALPKSHGTARLVLSGGYNLDLGDSSGGQDRTDNGWWVSLGIKADFGPSAAGAAPNVNSKTPNLSLLPPPTKWSASAGLGMRNLSGSFSSSRRPPFDSLGLVDRQRGSGASGFAGSGGATYKEGRVNGGTGKTSTYSGGHTTGSHEDAVANDPTSEFPNGFISYGGNRQVEYTSNRFGYRTDDSSFARHSDDEDQMLMPYFTVNYELFERGPFALTLGASYAFGKAFLDSGTSLATLSKAYEATSNYGFIYTVDEKNPAKFDPLKGDINKPDKVFISGPNGPQRTQQTIENEVERVAGFLSSTVDINMHEFALPLTVRYQLLNRLAVTLSVAPTLNIFDAELDSVYELRRLQNRDAGRVLVDNRDFKKSESSFNIPSTLGGGSLPGKSTTASSASASASASASPATVVPAGTTDSGDGKGRKNVPNPIYPGRHLRTEYASDRGQYYRFGVSSQLGLQVDLDTQKQWYLEAWGKYSYVDELTLENRFTSAEVDASAWSLGVGLGMRW